MQPTSYMRSPTTTGAGMIRKFLVDLREWDFLTVQVLFILATIFSK